MEGHRVARNPVEKETNGQKNEAENIFSQTVRNMGLVCGGFQVTWLCQ